MSGYFLILMAFSFCGVIAIDITNHGFQQEILEMKNNLTILQDNVLLMNATIQAQNDELKETKQRNEAYQLIIKDLMTDFNALRNTSQQEWSNMNASMQAIASQLNYTSLTLSSLQQSQTGTLETIAFTVAKSSAVSYRSAQRIVFDKIITNTGYHYDINSGIFTCPVAGTYVFTWSTMSSSSSEPCYAFIYHNGNGLMESYSYEYKGGYNEAASNTMVRQLKVGDRVWIEVLANTYCYGYPYTGFSGWKL